MSNSKHNGFTLLELLIVIVSIGLIGVILQFVMKHGPKPPLWPGFSSGYSPGHSSENSRVIILADHQGARTVIEKKEEIAP